jgi:hypothetical protein
MHRLLPALFLLLTACNATGIGFPSPETNPNPQPPTAEPLRIQFVAQVNGQPFQCGQTYQGIGTSQSTLTPKDFRLYLSQLRLRNAKGQEVPLQLTQDETWQYQNVALLDFENKTGTCEGTSATNTVVTATIPADDYQGLSFEIGLPFELNHKDASTAPAPLDQTSMFWVWRFGYKFARLDFASTGQPNGWYIHLGSTGCTGMANSMHVMHEGEDHGETTATPETPTTAPAMCSAPNRVTINLPEFQPNQHTVVLDLGKLVANSNVDTNQEGTPGGCMSSPDDNDCQGIFANLGHPFQGSAGGNQKFVSLVSK